MKNENVSKKNPNRQSLIIASAAALVAIIGISGLAYNSFAADTDDNKTFTVGEGRGYGQGRMLNPNLTDEEKAELETKRAEMEADRETRRAAMQTAIAGGYESWKAQVTEEFGADAPILETITASNFERYKEGHNLMEQGRTIMEELGVEGKGMGMGGRGHAKMGGRGMHDCPMASDGTNTATIAQ